MTPSEMIDAFYDGEEIATVARKGNLSVIEFECLLRGYIIGVRSVVNATADDDDGSADE